MAESRDYLEMSFRSIQCFADDGRLDAAELGRIVEIAERDGKLDANEIRVLKSIIGKITPAELDEPMKRALADLSAKLSRATA